MACAIDRVERGDAEMVKHGAFIGYIRPQWPHIRLRINLRTTDKGEARKMKENRFMRAC
ncbi:hypothetical protein HMPREF1617_00519 [Escherichia coli 908675]|nr:hypothetical protein HMPREF9539_04484 [Escherichia coli MS 110-3]EFU56052.1 hypothetical protein HMPREF9545_04186 [Escherichia coli MS 16-3]ESD12938.1 hypothetical protein HMPREF1590_00010 [Escherichia coli 113302]ESD40700.1 hypothetical protein HMPREF1604_02593 [Escherichia coli 908519]ESD74320.1 hypothetical protein HMPREF1609_02311 [Escherichia coli 908541]ESE22360.1 hypothetical protein HMPREF1617_00519 [Escherichia coli 908675]